MVKTVLIGEGFGNSHPDRMLKGKGCIDKSAVKEDPTCQVFGALSVLGGHLNGAPGKQFETDPGEGLPFTFHFGRDNSPAWLFNGLVAPTFQFGQ